MVGSGWGPDVGQFAVRTKLDEAVHSVNAVNVGVCVLARKAWVPNSGRCRCSCERGSMTAREANDPMSGVGVEETDARQQGRAGIQHSTHTQ